MLAASGRPADNVLLLAVTRADAVSAAAALEAGASLSSATRLGESALHLAVSKSQQILTLLLERLATGFALGGITDESRMRILDACTVEGFSPLHLAASLDKVEAVASLCRAGASVDVPGHLGSTPLHIAAANGSLRSAALLLDYNAAIDFKDRHGDTPLHRACQAGQLPMVELLKTRGADPRVTNDDGRVPAVDSAEERKKRSAGAARAERATRPDRDHVLASFGPVVGQ